MILKDSLKNRLLVDMIGEVRDKLPPEEFVCIVVDRHTSKILSSCCRMYDIMEAGVLVLENLSLVREKLDFHAIYFLENSNASVKRLLKDFPDKNRVPQYKAVHLFFTGRVSQSQMEKIQGRRKLLRRVKTFKEMNVDFIAYESRAFSLQRPNRAIHNIYLHNNDKGALSNAEALKNELQKTSSQIVSLCLTLKECPYIRYWDKSKAGTSDLCKGLAQFIDDCFKEKFKQIPDWKRNDKRKRGTLLVIDRSIDAAAPLMHEYTYQAMVNDLLKVDGEICTLPLSDSTDSKTGTSTKDKKDSEEGNPDNIILSEEDALWNEFRHTHIAHVMRDVSEKFKKFKQENALAQQRSSKQKEKETIEQMKDAVKALPEYKLMIQKYTKHITLAQSCFDFYEKYSLCTLGDLEQDMATGLTDDGDNISSSAIQRQLVEQFASTKIGVIEKLRLLMIYLITQGGNKKAKLQEYMGTIDTRLHAAVFNLPQLGVNIGSKKSNKNNNKARKAEFKKHSKQMKVTLMRYIPYLHPIVTKFVQGSLDKHEFPYIDPPPPEATDKRGKTHSKRWRPRAREEKDDDRPLFIVFVLGGMTFSELRSIYQIADSQKAKLIIGGSNILTASNFIRGLAKLTQTNFANAIEESKGNAIWDKDITADPDSESENEALDSDTDEEPEDELPTDVTSDVGSDCAPYCRCS